MFGLTPKQTKGVLIGLGVFVAAGTTYVVVKKARKKSSDKRDSRRYSDATEVTPTGTFNVIETAQQLAMDLGTYYPSWDPRSYTENDSDVRDTLKAFPKSLMKPLITEFSNKGWGNLQQLCQKLLPASYYAEIRDKFL